MKNVTSIYCEGKQNHQQQWSTKRNEYVCEIASDKGWEENQTETLKMHNECKCTPFTVWKRKHGGAATERKKFIKTNKMCTHCVGAAVMRMHAKRWGLPDMQFQFKHRICIRCEANGVLKTQKRKRARKSFALFVQAELQHLTTCVWWTNQIFDCVFGRAYIKITTMKWMTDKTKTPNLDDYVLQMISEIFRTSDRSADCCWMWTFFFRLLLISRFKPNKSVCFAYWNIHLSDGNNGRSLYDCKVICNRN